MAYGLFLSDAAQLSIHWLCTRWLIKLTFKDHCIISRNIHPWIMEKCIRLFKFAIEGFVRSMFMISSYLRIPPNRKLTANELYLCPQRRKQKYCLWQIFTFLNNNLHIYFTNPVTGTYMYPNLGKHMKRMIAYIINQPIRPPQHFIHDMTEIILKRHQKQALFP